MIYSILLILILFGLWFFIAGIKNKPPLESQQINGEGWDNSKFGHQYVAVFGGLTLIIAGIVLFILLDK